MSAVPEEPRVAGAGRGVAWWGEGWRLFAAALWPWVGIMVVYVLLTGAMNAVPFVGSIGQWLLTPVFMGGIMVGCRSLERQGSLKVTALFEGFQGDKFVQLLVIGLVNMGMVLAIVLIFVVAGFGFAQLASFAQAEADPAVALENALSSVGLAGLLVFLVVLAIVLVFAMLNWFAPALVALQGARALHAMKLSFLACMRNWLPFLVYGAVGLAVMLAVGMLLVGATLLAGVGAIGGGMSEENIAAIVGVGLLILAIMLVAVVIVGPIVFASAYAGYKDTLEPQEADLGNQAYR